MGTYATVLRALGLADCLNERWADT